MQYTHIHRWSSAWLQLLQCVSNGDTADPHQATDTSTHAYQIFVCSASIYIHTNIYIKVQNADHMHDIQMVYVEEEKLSDIGGHICWADIRCDLATGCVDTGSADIVSIFSQFTWFGDYWNMVLEIFDKYFTIDSPCTRYQDIVLYERASRTKEALCLVRSSFMYILEPEILLTSFRADLALKTRSLTFLVVNFTIICLCCPSLFKPTLWDTDMSCGSTGGSTFMSSQTFSTAASVSSWFGFSGMPATQKLSLWPCCSMSSSIVCWGSIWFHAPSHIFVDWEAELGGRLPPKLHLWTAMIYVLWKTQ